MVKFDTKFVWIGIAVLAVFFMFGGKEIITPGISEAVNPQFDVKLSIVEPDTGFAIITSDVKTKVGVTTVPFKLTVINSGSIALTNLRLSTGTIPTQLVNAFSGKTITSLAPGQAGVLTADVDVASLAPATGGKQFNFQAYMTADYQVGGQTFTKSGFSEPLLVTIYPEQGIAVTVTYE